MESTEPFVLLLFLVALPLIIVLFRNEELPGAKYFFLSFLFLLGSNIFTVVEEWIFPTLFNILEHVFIALASVAFYLAIRLFIAERVKTAENRNEGAETEA